MKTNWILALLALVGLVFIISGCNTVTTETIDPATGNTVKITKRSESPFKDKTVAMATNMVGIKASTAYDATTQEPMPSVGIYTGGNSLISAPKNCEKLAYATSESCGILNSITNSSATSYAMCFVGAKGDHGAGAARFIRAISVWEKQKNATGGAEASTTTTTTTSNSTTALSSVTITADTTAVAGKLYVIDASKNAITLTLPASPADGDKIGYSVTDSTNKVTINPNGKKISGATESVTVVKGASATLTYDSDDGWTAE